jgi:hypothetical protein
VQRPDQPDLLLRLRPLAQRDGGAGGRDKAAAAGVQQQDVVLRGVDANVRRRGKYVRDPRIGRPRRNRVGE